MGNATANMLRACNVYVMAGGASKAYRRGGLEIEPNLNFSQIETATIIPKYHTLDAEESVVWLSPRR